MAGKPLTEAPAPPLAVLCLGLPHEELHYEPGRGQEAGYGVGHYLSGSLRLCVCYNSDSGLDEGLNESCPGYMNMPPIAPEPSEEVL